MSKIIIGKASPSPPPPPPPPPITTTSSSSNSSNISHHIDNNAGTGISGRSLPPPPMIRGGSLSRLSDESSEGLPPPPPESDDEDEMEVEQQKEQKDDKQNISAVAGISAVPVSAAGSLPVPKVLSEDYDEEKILEQIIREEMELAEREKKEKQMEKKAKASNEATTNNNSRSSGPPDDGGGGTGAGAGAGVRATTNNTTIANTNTNNRGVVEQHREKDLTFFQRKLEQTLGTSSTSASASSATTTAVEQQKEFTENSTTSSISSSSNNKNNSKLTRQISVGEIKPIMQMQQRKEETPDKKSNNSNSSNTENGVPLLQFTSVDDEGVETEVDGTFSSSDVGGGGGTGRTTNGEGDDDDGEESVLPPPPPGDDSTCVDDSNTGTPSPGSTRTPSYTPSLNPSFLAAPGSFAVNPPSFANNANAKPTTNTADSLNLMSALTAAATATTHRGGRSVRGASMTGGFLRPMKYGGSSGMSGGPNKTNNRSGTSTPFFNSFAGNYTNPNQSQPILGNPNRQQHLNSNSNNNTREASPVAQQPPGEGAQQPPPPGLGGGLAGGGVGQRPSRGSTGMLRSPRAGFITSPCSHRMTPDGFPVHPPGAPGGRASPENGGVVDMLLKSPTGMSGALGLEKALVGALGDGDNPLSPAAGGIAAATPNLSYYASASPVPLLSANRSFVQPHVQNTNPLNNDSSSSSPLNGGRQSSVLSNSSSPSSPPAVVTLENLCQYNKDDIKGLFTSREPSFAGSPTKVDLVSSLQSQSLPGGQASPRNSTTAGTAAAATLTATESRNLNDDELLLPPNVLSPADDRNDENGVGLGVGSPTSCYEVSPATAPPTMDANTDTNTTANSRMSRNAFTYANMRDKMIASVTTRLDGALVGEGGEDDSDSDSDSDAPPPPPPEDDDEDEDDDHSSSMTPLLRSHGTANNSIATAAGIGKLEAHPSSPGGGGVPALQDLATLTQTQTFFDLNNLIDPATSGHGAKNAFVTTIPGDQSVYDVHCQALEEMVKYQHYQAKLKRVREQGLATSLSCQSYGSGGSFGSSSGGGSGNMTPKSGGNGNGNGKANHFRREQQLANEKKMSLLSDMKKLQSMVADGPNNSSRNKNSNSNIPETVVTSKKTDASASNKKDEGGEPLLRYPEGITMLKTNNNSNNNNSSSSSSSIKNNSSNNNSKSSNKTRMDLAVICDYNHHRLQIIDVNRGVVGEHQGGVIKTIGHGPGTGEGEFQFPTGVCVLPESGYIVVTDTNNHRLHVIDPEIDEYVSAKRQGLSGIALSDEQKKAKKARAVLNKTQTKRKLPWQGVAEKEFLNKEMLSMYANGDREQQNASDHPQHLNTLLARFENEEQGAMTLERIDAEEGWDGGVDGGAPLKPTERGGTFLATLGSGPGNGPSQFKYPHGICAVRENLVVVCDYYNQRLQLVDPLAETFLGVIGPHPDELLNSARWMPKGVCALPPAPVLNIAGEAIALGGGSNGKICGGATQSPPRSPDGLGDVVVTDYKNNRIQVINVDHMTYGKCLGAQYCAAFKGDDSMRLSHPTGIAALPPLASIPGLLPASFLNSSLSMSGGGGGLGGSTTTADEMTMINNSSSLSNNSGGSNGRDTPVQGGLSYNRGRATSIRDRRFNRLVIVCDYSHHRLQLVDVDAGEFLGMIGLGPSPSADPLGGFHCPTGISVFTSRHRRPLYQASLPEIPTITSAAGSNSNTPSRSIQLSHKNAAQLLAIDDQQQTNGNGGGKKKSVLGEYTKYAKEEASGVMCVVCDSNNHRLQVLDLTDLLSP